MVELSIAQDDLGVEAVLGIVEPQFFSVGDQGDLCIFALFLRLALCFLKAFKVRA